jgi:hypothetical protein
VNGASVAECNGISYSGQHGIDSHHLAAARKFQRTNHPLSFSAYREVDGAIQRNRIGRLQEEPANAQIPGESLDLEVSASGTKFEANGVVQREPQILSLVKSFDHRFADLSYFAADATRQSGSVIGTGETDFI